MPALNTLLQLTVFTDLGNQVAENNVLIDVLIRVWITYHVWIRVRITGIRVGNTYVFEVIGIRIRMFGFVCVSLVFV